MNLAQKLRQNAASGDSCLGVSEDMEAAANEIERLTLALTSMNEPKLDPCPCCGGPAEWEPMGNDIEWYAFCRSCNLVGPEGPKIEAAQKWNRRPGKEQP